MQVVVIAKFLEVNRTIEKAQFIHICMIVIFNHKASLCR